MGFTGESFSDGPNPFARFELHAHTVKGQLDGACEALPNGRSEILQLGTLKENGGVDVAQRIPAARGQLQCMFKKLNTLRPLPFRRSIRKMHPDIPQRHGAQNCVGDGMEEHVSVGMAIEPDVAGNVDASENQGPPRRQAVCVPALSYSDHGSLANLDGRVLQCQVKASEFHVARLGDLDIAIIAKNDGDFHLLKTLHERGLIGA